MELQQFENSVNESFITFERFFFSVKHNTIKYVLNPNCFHLFEGQNNMVLTRSKTVHTLVVTSILKKDFRQTIDQICSSEKKKIILKISDL